ncbi:hypothetical protein B0H21DRAFT_695466, partial [Amylocystis lapponica]
WVFSAVLLGLTAARLHYTTQLSVHDPLNAGHHFYDPIVAELLVSSLLTLLWTTFVTHTIFRSFEYGRFTSFASELLGLFVLFVFWLVGAAIATTYWGNLNWCWAYAPCRLLTALVAFAWMGWIVLLALLVISALFAVANSAFGDPLHGRYDPRLSQYGPSRTVRA